MAFFSCVLPNYKYNYFDKYNQFQEKQLNIFQYFLRKWFGYYAETHLSAVVKKAYSLTLSDQFQGSAKKRQELLQLIEKSQRVYGVTQSYVELYNRPLSSGKTAKISVRYWIDTQKISSVDFKINLIGNNSNQEVYKVSIFQNKSNRLVVSLPAEIFNEGISDNEQSIQSRLNGECATIVNDLIKKTLHDSSTCPQLADIYFYANDYRFMLRPIPSPFDVKRTPSPDVLNEAQMKAMNALGWVYFQQFVEEGKGLVRDAKCVYLLRREVLGKTKDEFKQTISLNFAVESLLPRSREY